MKERTLIVALAVSILLHAAILVLGTRHSHPLIFQRGFGTVEVEALPSNIKDKGNQGRRSVVTSKKSPLLVNTAPSKGSASAGTTEQSLGVTDGSELGIAPPEYPMLSRLRGEEGAVLVRLWLDSANRMVRIEVQESSGYPLLDRAAVKAITKALPPAPSSEGLSEKRIRFLFKLVPRG